MWGRTVAAGLCVWLLGGGASLAAAADAAKAPPAARGAPGKAAAKAPPAEPAPTGIATLRLTPLQGQILEQVFVRHAFTGPEPLSGKELLSVRVEPTMPGGIYRLGPGGDLPAKLYVAVRKPGDPAPVKLTWQAVDFYGRKVAEGALPPDATDASGALAADVELKDLFSAGYYHVYVTAASQDQKGVGGCGIVIVSPLEEERAAESPFGLAFPGDEVPEDLPEICLRLGVARLATSWVDGRDIANLPETGPVSADWRPEFRWTAGEKVFEELRNADLVPMGIIRPLRLAARLLPPASAGEPQAASPQLPESTPLLDTLAAISVEHYAGTIPDWQIGAGPLVGAGPWPGGAPEYRNRVEGVIREIRGLKVPARLWVAATPTFVADVLSEASGLKDADGVSLLVDAGARSPSLRSGAYRRSVDFGIQAARRFGLKGAVIGATGDDPSVGSPQQQAWKLVTRHVLALASGAQRVYVSYGRGLPTPLPSAAAYAWMVRMLDGLAYEAELWADVPLLQAHLFSSGKRRVAVVWSWAGGDPASPDRGALVFRDGFGLEAFDVVGHSVGLWKGRRLIVPLGEAPIYVLAKDLKSSEVRDRFRRAEVLGIAPVTAWVSRLERGDPPRRMNATLWVQGHRPYRIDATAALLLPEGWKSRQAKQRFSLDPGQVREVTFECDLAKDPGPGPYRIEAAVEADGAWTRRTQEVQVAQIPQRTIRTGFGLGDWEGIEPVRLRAEEGQPLAEVRAAYDSDFFYFAAEVGRGRDSFISTPDAYGGDAIQLAFGITPRADDDFGHVLPVFPAGAFRDTDHLMAITLGEKRVEVVRLRGSGAILRTHLAGNSDPWYGPVEGAQAAIHYDTAGGTAVYEAAIPMAALRPLKPERGQTLRFSFRIGDGKGAALDWAWAAGMPDYLANPTSFLPTSDAEALPCQTRWVLTGPVVREKLPSAKEGP